MKTTIHLHQTHHTVADFAGIFKTTTGLLKGNGLHLFPELYLCGYPLQDLVLQRPFIDAYIRHQDKLNNWVKNQSGEWKALMGGLSFTFESEEGVPSRIQNVIYEAVPGDGIKKVYTKRLLPNYDIFDEQKYFSKGTSNAFYEFNGDLYGLQICEDMWASSFHEIDPCQLMFDEAKEKNYKLKAIINLSASPFEAAKKSKRLERAKNISLLFGCPFIYVNRVGGEDEILFDGTSFVLNGPELIKELDTFKPSSAELNLEGLKSYEDKPRFSIENTWEGLFSPRIDFMAKPVVLKSWTKEECSDVLKALQFGLQEYARKNGFKKFLIALSGGIDSALVLAITKLSLQPNQSLEAIYMPSIHSASLSTQLSEEICRRLKVPLSYFPIKFLHTTVKNSFVQSFNEPFAGLTDENVQSRLRGLLLYTRSNQTDAMVINTSNKSELAVGYSTQYGDSVGALSLLGDLYKTEVYQLANFINEHFNSPIPEEIITRGPSAELRENQLDQDSLPPYERLDTILEGILSYRLGMKQLLELGLPENEVIKTLQLYSKSEYKRAQFCPILKVKAKSFGFGYRIPISKSYNYQLEC